MTKIILKKKESFRKYSRTESFWYGDQTDLLTRIPKAQRETKMTMFYRGQIGLFQPNLESILKILADLFYWPLKMIFRVGSNKR